MISKKIKINIKILTILVFTLFFAAKNALEFLFPEVNFFGIINYFLFKHIISRISYTILLVKTAPYIIINIIFSLLLVYVLLQIVIKNKSLKIHRKILILLLFTSAIPLTYSMYFLSPGVYYHRLMELGIFFIYLILFMFLEHQSSYFTKTIRLCSILLLTTLSFYHFVNDNIAYKQIEMSYKRTSFEMMQILGEIDRLGSSDKNNCIAVIGGFPKKLHPVYAKPDITGASTNNFLPTDFHFIRFSKYYFAREFSACSDDQKAELEKNADFIEMPEYPKAGFVKIINDIVVVKLHDE